MIDFVILTIILLFLEAWHDWRMNWNYEASIFCFGSEIREKFQQLWDKDHEQKTKLIKAGIILLTLLFCWYRFGIWEYIPTYGLLRFTMFDIFYYSFEKGRIFGLRTGDFKEWWDRSVYKYWLGKL